MTAIAPFPALINGLGASTPVGRSAWASAAAVRSGITGFVRHPYMVDTAGEPMRVAIAPWLDIGLQGADRLAALLLPAMEEALAGLPAPVPADRFALALGLPSARPGLPPDVAGALLQRVHQRWGGLFGRQATFEAGHAAGLLALQAACQQLNEGRLDACLVAGVDSWIAPATLEWLEAQDQLHGAGPLNNAWGFIPGEGAGALLLLREGAGNLPAPQALARVLGVGQAHEPKRIKTQTVCIGEGLTSAFQAALQAVPASARVTDIYCDMNGEPYRADEFGFTALRTGEHFESASDFVAPADCWGDMGAAGGPLHVLLACVAAHKGYANGPLAFVWSSAETGERAAALLACG
ncbi:MAG: beta-ketoacyl synthase [Rubrivivax sp.]|nr:MAG: beta-ketoacyl synthase [Rubrivivax sp.]